MKAAGFKGPIPVRVWSVHLFSKVAVGKGLSIQCPGSCQVSLLALTLEPFCDKIWAAF